MREADIAVTDAEFEAMGIEDLLAMTREAGVVTFEELACHGTGAVVQVTVESRYDEERLATLACVDDWEYVGDTDRGHLYVVEFTAPNLPDHLADRAAELLGTCDPELTEDGSTLSLVGTQETISRTIEEYRTAGVTPELRKLGAYRGRPDPLDSLTDRQAEVLETAHEMGYYEVPREISTEDVARSMDLDPSTVAEHLQRAERNLLGRLL